MAAQACNATWSRRMLREFLPGTAAGLAASRLTGEADRVMRVEQRNEDDAKDLLIKMLPHNQSYEKDKNEVFSALERLLLAMTQITRPRVRPFSAPATLSKFIVLAHAHVNHTFPADFQEQIRLITVTPSTSTRNTRRDARNSLLY